MDIHNKWKINKNQDAQFKKTKEIITRFPPEPSGYLHIGHVKAIFINYVIAKKYNGKFIVRLDDTNPETESTEYEQSILEDIAKLGVVADKYSRTSDYFNKILDHADKLVEDGLAYVDDTDKETLKQQRRNFVESKDRNNDIEVNIKNWNYMKEGIKLNCVLRLKLDFKSKNGAMRDPTIYRSGKSHHFTLDKYKVYPTYDFACPIVDVIEGVTHVYRSTEFNDRDAQYNAILSMCMNVSTSCMLNLEKPRLASYGKIEFKDAMMSKRKIKDLIKEGKVSGWDDPSLMTIRGLFRRGLCLDALIDFISRMGFSKNNIEMTQDALWGINKKLIDKVATRYMAIKKDNLMKMCVSYNQSHDSVKNINNFIKNPSLGIRPIYYSPNIYIDKDEYKNVNKDEKITLMNWGNMIKKNKVGKLKSVLIGGISLASLSLLSFKKIGLIGGTLGGLCGGLVGGLLGPMIWHDYFKMHLEGYEKTDKKLLWIANNKMNKPTILYIQDCDKKEMIMYIGEPDMINIQVGDYIQLLKMDYYRCDSKNDGKIVLIKV